NATDLSGNNPSSTPNGISYAAGRVGQAFNFDGFSQYVETLLDVQPLAMPTCTWEAWVYPTRVSFGARQQILSDDDGGFDRSVLIEAGTSNFGVFPGSSVWQPVAVTPNAWQHIAVVFSPTNIEFYKNGVRFSLGAAPTFGGSGNLLQIG